MSDDGRRSGPPPSSAGPEHDAWLREALRHAPDASASPPPSLSDAILAEARAAARSGSARRTAASPSLLDRALAFWRRAGEKLLDCLEQLPLPQRSAFLLHHDDGLTLDEVAHALEVGFETAKTRLRYAMSKLRTCMGAYLEPLQGGGL